MSFEAYYNDYKAKRDDLVNAMFTALDADDFDKFEVLKNQVDELDKTASTNQELHTIMSQIKDGILEPGIKNEKQTFEDVQQNVNVMAEAMAVNNIDMNSGGNDMGSFGTENKTKLSNVEMGCYGALTGTTVTAEQVQAYNNYIAVTSPTDNKPILPPEWTNRIYTAVISKCPLVKDVKPINSDNNVVVYKATLAGLPLHHLEGDDIISESAITGMSSGDEFVPVTVNVADIVRIVRVSDRMHRNAPEAFIDALIDMASDAIVSAIEVHIAVVMSNNAQTINCTTSKTFGIATINTALAKLSVVDKNTAVYASTATVYNDLATLTDKTGRPLMTIVPADDNGVVGYLNGVPVKVTCGVIDHTILVANATNAVATVLGANIRCVPEVKASAMCVDYVFSTAYNTVSVNSNEVVKITGTDKQATDTTTT